MIINKQKIVYDENISLQLIEIEKVTAYNIESPTDVNHLHRLSGFFWGWVRFSENSWNRR